MPLLPVRVKEEFFDPRSVEALIRKMCRHESSILQLLYGCETLRLKAGMSQVRVDPQQLYKAFFLQALAVPPNR